ncbi:MAG: STAS domain-containing protein [Treponema sp.]|nr:STAS domain-containing protein [Treponema sp.]
MQNNDIVPGFDDEKDESLKIELKQVPEIKDCLVLAVDGYIDTYNSVYFQRRVHMAIDGGYNKLIFNCDSLNYVSSTGIGSFITFLKTVKPDGDVVLFNIQPKVYEVFQLLGFSQFFNVKKSYEESVEFFNSNEGFQQDLSIFPKIFPCPVCSKKLKAVKTGRFRCSECKSILAIGDIGTISLG